MNWPDGVPVEYRDALVVGDALDYLRRFGDGSVPLFLFSPPYNLSARAEGSGGFPNRHYPKGRKLGHYPDGARLGGRGGPGKWSGGALAKGYGQVHDDALPPEQYQAWQQNVLRECWRALAEDGAIYYNHKPRILNGVLHTPLEFNPGLPLRQIVIWARAGGINFSTVFYCPTHEWLVIFAKPDFRLKSKGASGVGDVWRIPQESNNPHPAPFPAGTGRAGA